MAAYEKCSTFALCLWIVLVYMEREVGLLNPYRLESPSTRKRVRMIAVTDSPMEVVNKSTGEVKIATPYIGRRSVRDVTEFVKLYDAKRLMDLHPYEWKVLLYAADKLQFEGDWSFDYKECMNETGMSKSNVFRGLDGLLEKDIIRRKGKGAYWINPNIIYRGSRDSLL